MWFSKYRTLIIPAVLAVMTQAETFTGNPDSNGIYWDGVTNVSALDLAGWHSRLSAVGADLTSVKYLVANGSIYMNTQFEDLGVTIEQYQSASSTVATSSDGSGLQFDQADYIVHTNATDGIWRVPRALDPRLTVHSIYLLPSSSPTSTQSQSDTDQFEGYQQAVPYNESSGVDLVKRSSPGAIGFEYPSFSNNLGVQNCFTNINVCVSAKYGYKVITGVAMVSGVNWLVGFSHHFCRIACADNYRITARIRHKNRKAAAQFPTLRNIYSGGLATQRTEPTLNWGSGKPSWTCGPFYGPLPACDRVPTY